MPLYLSEPSAALAPVSSSKMGASSSVKSLTSSPSRSSAAKSATDAIWFHRTVFNSLTERIVSKTPTIPVIIAIATHITRKNILFDLMINLFLLPINYLNNINEPKSICNITKFKKLFFLPHYSKIE